MSSYTPKLEGCQFERKRAFEITPVAGNLTEQSRWRLMEAVRYFQEEGVDVAKLTQKAVAKVSGHSRSRIAQIATEFGGWKMLKKLLAVLITNSMRLT